MGIEIRHRDGIARIQSPDLDQKWQDRFQWGDEERLKRIKDEQMNQQGIAQESKSVRLPESGNVRRLTELDHGKDKVNINLFRTQVIAWRRKINMLTSEKAEVRSQANGGKHVSVAGSLETLNAKIARLAGEIAKAQAELAVAKSHLAEIAPNDFLLRTADGYPGEY